MSDRVTIKTILRSEIRELLKATPPELIESASASICRHIAHSEKLLRHSTTIGIYAAHGNEIALHDLHGLLPDVRLLYPLCRPGYQLSFHHVCSAEELAPGHMNIPEPDADRHQQVSIGEIDLILCPGLAFGMDGSRLGRGSGYYDRALEKFTGIKCGIAMARQIKPSVPHAQHDSVMDFLASEGGITTTKPQ